MYEYTLFVIARAVHVVAVVLWIGGVAFVTTVLIPALKRLAEPEQRLQLFESLEGRFSLQAKFVTLTTGLSGLYMIDFTQSWQRYLYIEFWWMHLMTLVWAIFTLVLFVLEPLFLHQWFHRQAMKNSEKTFNLVHRMHIFLLSLSLIAVFGAVAGGHGVSFTP